MNLNVIELSVSRHFCFIGRAGFILLLLIHGWVVFSRSAPSYFRMGEASFFSVHFTAFADMHDM